MSVPDEVEVVAGREELAGVELLEEDEPLVPAHRLRQEPALKKYVFKAFVMVIDSDQSIIARDSLSVKAPGRESHRRWFESGSGSSSLQVIAAAAAAQSPSN